MLFRSVPENVTVEHGLPDIQKPGLSTAVGLIMKGFERMENENAVYNTFTPFVKQPIVEKTSDQKPETTDVKKEKKKFSFSKILSSFSNDNMFNNNEA